jgi:hypothetical protein
MGRRGEGGIKLQAATDSKKAGTQLTMARFCVDKAVKRETVNEGRRNNEMFKREDDEMAACAGNGISAPLHHKQLILKSVDGVTPRRREKKY